MLKALNSEGIL